MTDHQVALLEAWSTFAAMLFAAVAVVFAYRAYLKESRIEQRLRDSDERAQASLVAAWVGRDPAKAGSTSARRSYIIVRNASQVPVTDVWCWIDGPVADHYVADWSVVPPSETGVFHSIHMETHKIAEDIGKVAADLPVGIEFTDASGQRWRRDPDGQLAKHIKSDQRPFGDLEPDG